MKNTTSKTALSNSKAVIVSYTFKADGRPTYIAGPPQDLFNYLKKRCRETVFIEQPMSYSQDLTPAAVVFREGREAGSYKFPMSLFPLKRNTAHIQAKPFSYLLFKIRDVLSTFYFFLKLRRKFDIYIGVEAVNALLGIFFRFFGLVKIVVYDIIDYSPRRFDNRVLNFVYHKLDKFCVYHCNYAWNQTDRIAAMRFKMGVNPKKAGPQLIKASGIDVEKVKKTPLKNINKFGLIYVGGLFKTDGLDIVIKGLPELCGKFDKLHLTVVGHGDRRLFYEEILKKTGLEGRVSFLGTIGEQEKIEKLLRENAVGLAPYLADENSLKYYNDPSKPKLYLSCGLAVVITRVPKVAFEIENAGAGRAINYDRGELVDAVTGLLENDELLERCRDNAVKLALRYGWENIFDALFRQMNFEVT